MKYHVTIHFDFAGNCAIEADSEEQAVAIAEAKINAGQITPDDIDLDPTGNAKATIAGCEDPTTGEIIYVKEIA